MNENINLVEILKDCPKGWKLYTTVWGEVTFNRIDNEKQLYPIYIEVDADYITSLTKKGYYANKIDADCILFPSKDQRDWSKFTAPWYKKERDAIACLETQGEDKKEINNNFDVLPGLYKCIHRMFDGTPDGRLLFEIGNVYKCLSKHNRAEFEVSHGHSVYLEDPVVCKYFIPFESKGEQVPSQNNERAWLHIVSDVLTWQDGIGQYLDNPEVQELAKRLSSKYSQKLYNTSYIENDEQKSADKVEPKFKVGDRVRHKETNKDDVYEISKVYDDSYGIAGFNWMIYMKYQDQYELVPNKFDPRTLQPFDKVLCRNGIDIWRCDFFSSYNENRVCSNVCIGGSYLNCIPYNDETKRLVGTDNETPKFYRYWED